MHVRKVKMNMKVKMVLQTDSWRRECALWQCSYRAAPYLTALCHRVVDDEDDDEIDERGKENDEAASLDVNSTFSGVNGMESGGKERGGTRGRAFRTAEKPRWGACVSGSMRRAAPPRTPFCRRAFAADRMIIHGADALPKLLAKKWVRPNKWACMLPYYDALEREADEIYTQLVNGLCAASLTEEAMPGLYTYIDMLEAYVDKYRLRFTREDLIRLARVLVLTMCQESQPYQVVHAAASALTKLLVPSRLTRDDMKIDWKLIYDLYFGAKYGKLHHLKSGDIKAAVIALRPFFPLEATREIWDEILQWLNPTYSGERFVHLCIIFLPTKLTIEEHATHGSSIWFPTLWKLYTAVEMNNKFTNMLPEQFAKLAADCPGVMDWSPYHEEIFTRTVRSLGLSAREGKVSMGEGSPDVQTAKLAAYLLGGPKSVQPYISRLMQCVEPFLHPSNDGAHTKYILQWIEVFASRIVIRYRRERISKREAKIKLTPPSLRLSDADVTAAVECLMPCLMLSVYTNFENLITPALLASLAFLEPGIVLPRILDAIYPALNAVCEPHRLEQTLACLQQVTVVLVGDSKAVGKRVPLKDDWEKMLDESDPSLDAAEMRRRAKLRPSLSAPLRQHVIHLMKTLVNAIDINDIDKTTSTIQILCCFYILVPIADCSKAADNKNFTAEEKHVAWLTRELPGLAEKTLDKILAIIQCVSVCAPKSSAAVIGGLKETTSNEGYDEKKLKTVLDRCVGLMLANADKNTVRSLTGKILEFVRTNQFESSVATEITSGLVGQCNYFVPEMWSSFMKLLKKKLKEALDADTRSKKDMDVSALWYCNIAMGLFYTPGKTLVKYQDEILETLELIVSCNNRNAYESGVSCIWYTLYNLLRIYVDNNPENRLRIEKAAQDGTAIRLWGHSSNREQYSLCWHLTSKPETIFAHKILSTFLFAEIERLQKPEELSRDELRKSLYIAQWSFNAAVYSFPIPKDEPVEILESSIPLSIVVPTDGIAMATAPQLKMPNGGSVRLALLGSYEKVVDYLLTSKKDDVFALTYVSQSIRTLTHSEMADTTEYVTQAIYALELIHRVKHHLHCNKAVVTELLETYVQFEHLKHIQSKPVMKFTRFHQRVLEVLTKLSMSMYAEVRAQAQTELANFMNDYMGSRILIADTVCRALTDLSASKGEIKGALYIMAGTGMAKARNLTLRKTVWEALVNFKPNDKPNIVALMEEISKDVKETRRAEMIAKPCAALSKLCSEWFCGVAKTGDWAVFASAAHLETQKKVAAELIQKREKNYTLLVSSLTSLASSSALHYTRADLCHLMMWRAQMHLSNLETVKLLTALLIDERPHIRKQATACLRIYLQKNKPKTKRVEWTPPKKTPSSDPVECGLRPDNLCIAYDSTCLPTTAEKWAATAFHSKQKGCHTWPKRVTVAAPSPAIHRPPLTPQEHCIVDAFSNKVLFNRWMMFLLIEKQDSTSPSESVYMLVKYLLRNFPNHPAIYNNVFGTLLECLKSRKRAYQRLAADLFLGLVRGVKHYSFERLDTMWKTLLPSLHKMYDQMLTETQAQWAITMDKVWSDDARRHWWLAESFVVEMRKIAPTPWHQTNRLEAVRAVYFHEAELRTRISRIAWEQLPRGKIETQRLGVAGAIMSSQKVLMGNLRNSLQSVPERFRPDGFDSWLEKLEKEVEPLFQEKMARAEKTKSDSDLRSMKTARAVTPPARSRKEKSQTRTPMRQQSLQEMKTAASMRSPARSSRSASNSSQTSPTARHEIAIVYLRTLLEVLLCYYEECIQALTPGVTRLFPKLVHYANEDDTGGADAAYNPAADVRAAAATLILDYMSSLRLTEATADLFLRTVVNTYRTPTWRVRVAVMRIVQVLIPSNIYVCVKGDRPQMIRSLIFEALADQQIEVRVEASKCLLSMQQSSFIDSASLIPDLMKMMSSPRDSHRHGAVLALGSVVLAHPYTTPAHVIPIIRTLCTVPHRETAAIKMAAHTAITGYRSSHRDMWEESSRLLGADLVYCIENALAPSYYV